MSARRSDARERMLQSSVALIRERGASATSIDHVLAHSGAPRGSIYHHFPGGRAQLVKEAVEVAGRSIGASLESAGEASPVEVLDAFLSGWRANLLASEFRAGCPVLAVAIEHDESRPEPAEAAARALAGWRALLSRLLVRNGIGQARAQRLATLVVASVEGAVVLCRADRDVRPLDDVGAELRELLARASAAT